MSKADADLVVSIVQGRIGGAYEPTGVRVWRGIPYASAPTGDDRFTIARPPSSWSGIRDATDFGPICPQPPLAGIPPAEAMGDDCLTVNIWSPPGADALPVLVWIHGGAHLWGSGSSPALSGAHLAAQESAVVVTLNYRLGVRGFLDLSTVPGSEGRFETNLGLRDQMAALTWVQENINRFGGDPARVTIAGQSAGGASVCCLIASPLARGLFSAAIAQSPPAASIFDRRRARTVTEYFLSQTGVRDATFDDLLALDDTVLLDVSGRALERMTSIFPGHHAFQPVIDGEVLLDTPARSIARGDGSSVPLLIGSNQDEGSLFTSPPMPALIPTTENSIEAWLTMDHSAVADRVRAAYQTDGAAIDGIALGGDGMITAPALAVARGMSTRAPVFVYRLRWSDAQLEAKRLGTPHTIDVPLVFGTPTSFRLTDLTADDAILVSRRMQSAWLAFAHAHDPTVDERPWPEWGSEDGAVMVIDSTMRTEAGLDTDRLNSWIHT